MLFFDIHIVSIVSSVSARKLKCPSSEPSQLGLARAGKFQLELISNLYQTRPLLYFQSKTYLFVAWNRTIFLRKKFIERLNSRWVILCFLDKMCICDHLKFLSVRILLDCRRIHQKIKKIVFEFERNEIIFWTKCFAFWK